MLHYRQVKKEEPTSNRKILPGILELFEGKVKKGIQFKCGYFIFCLKNIWFKKSEEAVEGAGHGAEEGGWGVGSGAGPRVNGVVDEAMDGGGGEVRHAQLLNAALR